MSPALWYEARRTIAANHNISITVDDDVDALELEMFVTRSTGLTDWEHLHLRMDTPWPMVVAMARAKVQSMVAELRKDRPVSYIIEVSPIVAAIMSLEAKYNEGEIDRETRNLIRIIYGMCSEEMPRELAEWVSR